MNEFVKEQELDNILLKLLVSRKNFEEKLLELIMKLLENESSMFLFGFKREIEQHNQFKELEALYYFSEDIKEVYSKCIDIFNKNAGRFKSDEIKEILNGIIWSLENILNEYPKECQNKIELERIEMVSEAIQHMKDVIKESIQRHINHIPSGFLNIEISKLIEELLRQVFEKEGSSIKDIYGYTMKTLNVLDRRIEGRKYINFITSARKNLDTFKSIHVDTMMSNIHESDDIEAFKNIIAIIHELSNKLSNKEKELYILVNESVFSTITIQQSYDKLKDHNHMIERVMKNEDLIEFIISFQDNKLRIFEKLAIEVSDELKKTVAFTLDEINDQSIEVQYLSCQVVQALKQAHEQLSEDKFKRIGDSEETTNLIRILADTIKLKYETLKEKDLAYIINKKEDFIDYEKQLMDFSVDFNNNLGYYFEKMLAGSKEQFINIKEAFSRLVYLLKEQNLKADGAYLKTDLLFEMVTLEEIVKFCLPKLKVHEKESVKELVQLIEDCYLQIENKIKHSGIEMIEPNIHDKFNGKEQEIILVESVEGFKKGEIVAVHTKGYKYKNIPVVRANVIAAK
ncbi:MAG: nucleotide exchange factor GrpE [Firmicutes bacterium HGW-Firmicutes-7]|nr:MAG: nucleotide exchange factor GrpE [Firmicutes bacterium HGW-Firmicutes-7]